MRYGAILVPTICRDLIILYYTILYRIAQCRENTLIRDTIMRRASEKITGFKCSILVIMLTGNLINKLIRPHRGDCCDIVKIYLFKYVEMGTNSSVDFMTLKNPSKTVKSVEWASLQIQKQVLDSQSITI